MDDLTRERYEPVPARPPAVARQLLRDILAGRVHRSESGAQWIVRRARGGNARVSDAQLRLLALDGWITHEGDRWQATDQARQWATT